MHNTERILEKLCKALNFNSKINALLCINEFTNQIHLPKVVASFIGETP